MIEKIEEAAHLMMIPNNVNRMVLIFVCCCFFGGAAVFLEEFIRGAVEAIKQKINERKTRVKLKKKESNLNKHLRYLLEVSTMQQLTVFQFKMICMAIFLLFFTMTIKVLLPGASILISAAVAVLPYFVLRVRLETRRSYASHEAEILVNELLIKYRIKKYNIEEALEEVIKVKRLNKTRKMVSKLLLKLRSSRNEKEIKEAIDIFSYSIETNWAKVLGSNIYQASVSGINITTALEDLLIQLRDARKLWEEQIRNTAEPRRMLWGIPILYLFFLYISLNVLDLPLRDYIQNQFASEQGVTFFAFIIIGFSVSVILVILLFSRKFDF